MNTQPDSVTISTGTEVSTGYRLEIRSTEDGIKLPTLYVGTKPVLSDWVEMWLDELHWADGKARHKVEHPIYFAFRAAELFKLLTYESAVQTAYTILHDSRCSTFQIRLVAYEATINFQLKQLGAVRDLLVLDEAREMPPLIQIRAPVAQEEEED